jgi:hypothetical protein
MKTRFLSLPFYFLIFSFIGCYSLEKKYNYGNPYLPSPAFEDGEPQFEEGEPVWIVDKLGHYFFSLPSKLVLWNWNMESHEISEETKEYMKKYIIDNNLRDVKVRFNQYAPLSEWRRLTKNENVSAFARYTVGIFSLLAYTFLPERLLAGIVGGDHYNSFTNTINIYSNSIPVVIHEGGHAKDFSQRKNRTAYAIVYAVPIVGPLYHEARASDDALNYFAEKNDRKQMEDAYDILVPAYSTYVGGSIADLVINPITSLTVIPGHFYGRYKKRSIGEQMSLRKRK